jgi:hypothetical protein
MNTTDIFKNNRLVDNGYLSVQLNANNINDFGKYGNYWIHTFRAIPMLNDLRTRSSLPFVTPWGCDEHPVYMQMPELKFTDKNLTDILDERAIELHKTAVNDNKKIWIMWSGGIDSTTMLTAFLRNIAPNELAERYSVVMSANSVAENYLFFKDQINGKFNLINWLDLDLSETLLKDTIVLHGDPANALLSVPTGAAFRNLVPMGGHLAPFRDNVDILIDNTKKLDKSDGRFSQNTSGWAEWYIHKLVDAIPVTDNATSIAAFWWWHYINFKWHGSVLRPFFFTRTSTDVPISEEEFKYYYTTCFYINDDFHNWSYSNIDRIVKTPFDYKPEMRDYIYTITNDELYTKYKKYCFGPITCLQRLNYIVVKKL